MSEDKIKIEDKVSRHDPSSQSHGAVGRVVQVTESSIVVEWDNVPKGCRRTSELALNAEGKRWKRAWP